MKEKLLMLQVYAKMKKDQFLQEERGEVNMIAIIMIIAVVILLAVVFKTQIVGLVNKLFGTIGNNADAAMTKLNTP